MKDVIKHFHTILNCKRFIVTGPYALHLMGLVEKSHDLDIILVNPTEETKEMLAKLQECFPAKTKPTGNGEVTYIFMYEKIKIDIFIINSIYTDMDKLYPVSELTIAGTAIEVNRINNIIKAKKRIGRIKDWVQLRGLAKKFFTQPEFEQVLDRTYNTGDYETSVTPDDKMGTLALYKVQRIPPPTECTKKVEVPLPSDDDGTELDEDFDFDFLKKKRLKPNHTHRPKK